MLIQTSVTPFSDLLDGTELLLHLLEELIALLLNCKSWDLVAQRTVLFVLIVSAH